MSKVKYWTDEEDKILVQAIIDSPHNKAETFRKVALQINRTEAAVSCRWYTILSNPEHKKYVGCLYTLVGIHSHLKNRSLYKDDCHIAPTQHKKTLWSKIRKIFGF